jgi:hypothetical protein
MLDMIRPAIRESFFGSDLASLSTHMTRIGRARNYHETLKSNRSRSLNLGYEKWARLGSESRSRRVPCLVAFGHFGVPAYPCVCPSISRAKGLPGPPGRQGRRVDNPGELSGADLVNLNLTSEIVRLVGWLYPHMWIWAYVMGSRPCCHFGNMAM